MTSPRPLPGGWRWAALGEVCEINPRRPRNLPAAPDEPVTFIPMSAVNEGASAVTQPQERPLAEVTRGYTYMEDGDVIFAKITPCMQNGKHAIVGDTLTGFAFGSTEFHVLRPGDAIHPVWVHRFLLQPSVLREAQQHFTGTAGQQRVPKQYLIEKLIPLPPIEEQRRIVADLEARMEAAGRARSAAEAQLAAVLALPAALLREAFTSRADRQRRAQRARLWRSARLGDICRVFTGGPAPQGQQHFDSTGPFFFRVSDLSASGGRTPTLSVARDRLSALALETRNLVHARAGTVVFPKSGAAIATNNRAMLGVDGYLVSHLMALEAYENLVLPSWLYHATCRLDMMDYSGNEGYPSLRKSAVEEIEIPLPPLGEQRRIVADLEAGMADAERARRAAEAQLAAAEALPSAILRGAFAGEAA